jgi:hypothetical protein
VASKNSKKISSKILSGVEKVAEDEIPKLYSSSKYIV